MKIKKQIAPGLWIDGEDQLHLDPGPYLEHMGIPNTHENREAACEAMKQYAHQEMPTVPIIDVFD